MAAAGASSSGLKQRSSGSKDDVSSLSASKKDLSRPLARKDVLYTGSITNLPEYQSQKSIASYRQSVVSIPKATAGAAADNKSKGCCSCLPESVTSLMDFSLMKDPVFLFIGVSNIFGMLGFYVPFVYIIDAATERVCFWLLVSTLVFFLYFKCNCFLLFTRGLMKEAHPSCSLLSALPTPWVVSSPDTFPISPPSIRYLSPTFVSQ